MHRRVPDSYLIQEYQRQIAQYEGRIERLNANIEETQRVLEEPELTSKKRKSLQRALRRKAKYVAEWESAIENQRTKLQQLLRERKRERIHLTLQISVVVIVISAFLLWLICCISD